MHNYFWKARSVERGELRWRHTGSATRSRSSAWAARTSVSTGTSRPTTCSSSRPSAALKSAGIVLDDVDAFWLGTMGSGLSGLTLSRPLKIDHKPVTHVENFCATGSEAFRNACYAVASGAYDVAMAIGVEKLKDSGYSGLVVSSPANDGTSATVTAPASFSPPRPGLRQEVRRRPRRDEGRADPHRVEEPQERGAQPAGAVPQGGLQGDHRVQPDRRRPARHLRLLRRVRRLGRGDRRAGRGRPQATPITRCT